MKIIIFTGSPNKDGLTAACGKAAEKGLELGGAEYASVCLNDLNISLCHACGKGWGTCRDRHECQVADDFQKLHSEMSKADGYIIITPVYWGDMSERTKAFTDRLRRCEALNQESSILEGKPFICVAAAGGTGNGCISCLESLERFTNHVRGVKFDFIAVTRKSRAYKLDAIKEAAKAMTDFMRQ